MCKCETERHSHGWFISIGPYFYHFDTEFQYIYQNLRGQIENLLLCAEKHIRDRFRVFFIFIFYRGREWLLFMCVAWPFTTRQNLWILCFKLIDQYNVNYETTLRFSAPDITDRYFVFLLLLEWMAVVDKLSDFLLLLSTSSEWCCDKVMVCSIIPVEFYFDKLWPNKIRK